MFAKPDFLKGQISFSWGSYCGAQSSFDKFSLSPHCGHDLVLLWWEINKKPSSRRSKATPKFLVGNKTSKMTILSRYIAALNAIPVWENPKWKPMNKVVHNHLYTLLWAPSSQGWNWLSTTQTGKIFFLLEISVLTFLAIQASSTVAVGLHFHNLPGSM